ncbi:hypothetical protein FPV67DRAFT_1422547 [Lyophyllum atratum]|nr:hypothetical protein FPV67DRAFT_1422547 [Lyophyllum atratum]
MAHCHSIETKQKLFVLYAEERRLIEALSTVRTRLNDLAPVSRLPTEVIEDVFGICVSWLYEHRKPEHRLAWTQVCRRWRCISFNAARLWRCIDLCDSRIAHEFLIRSGSAPIHLISTSPSRLCIGDLQNHAERVKSLDVHLFPEDLTNLFSSFGPNLPNLTSLTLKVPPVSTNFILDITARIPRLTRVALDCVSIPWNLCTGLTHLSLRGLGAGFAPSLRQLRSIFESSPNLEHIRLGCISPALLPTSDTPPSATALIPLPYLRELFIAAKAPVILCILSSISLPPTARLQINCSQFDGLRALFPLSPSALSMGTGLSTYPTLDIRAIRLEREGVRLFPPAARGAWLEDPSDSIISFGSAWPISKHFLPDMPLFFDLSRVTALELGSAVLFDMARGLLVEFLAHLPAVEELRIAFSASLADLLLALSHPSSDASPTQLTPPHPHPHNQIFLCPNLKRISFGRARDEVWWHFGEEWLPSLVALAKARHGAGIPLEALEFTRCHGVAPGVWEEFGGLVGNIWVGVGRDGDERV